MASDKLCFVECPKCGAHLNEIPYVPVYRCNGCGTVLLAKSWRTQKAHVILREHENNSYKKSMSDSKLQNSKLSVNDRLLPVSKETISCSTITSILSESEVSENEGPFVNSGSWGVSSIVNCSVDARIAELFLSQQDIRSGLELDNGLQSISSTPFYSMHGEKPENTSTMRKSLSKKKIHDFAIDTGLVLITRETSVCSTDNRKQQSDSGQSQHDESNDAPISTSEKPYFCAADDRCEITSQIIVEDYNAEHGKLTNDMLLSTRDDTLYLVHRGEEHAIGYFQTNVLDDAEISNGLVRKNESMSTQKENAWHLAGGEELEIIYAYQENTSQNENVLCEESSSTGSNSDPIVSVRIGNTPHPNIPEDILENCRVPTNEESILTNIETTFSFTDVVELECTSSPKSIEEKESENAMIVKREVYVPARKKTSHCSDDARKLESTSQANTLEDLENCSLAVNGKSMSVGKKYSSYSACSLGGVSFFNDIPETSMQNVKSSTNFGLIVTSVGALSCTEVGEKLEVNSSQKSMTENINKKGDFLHHRGSIDTEKETSSCFVDAGRLESISSQQISSKTQNEKSDLALDRELLFFHESSSCLTEAVRIELESSLNSMSVDGLGNDGYSSNDKSFFTDGESICCSTNAVILENVSSVKCVSEKDYDNCGHTFDDCSMPISEKITHYPIDAICSSEEICEVAVISSQKSRSMHLDSSKLTLNEELDFMGTETQPSTIETESLESFSFPKITLLNDNSDKFTLDYVSISGKPNISNKLMIDSGGIPHFSSNLDGVSFQGDKTDNYDQEEINNAQTLAVKEKVCLSKCATICEGISSAKNIAVDVLDNTLPTTCNRSMFVNSEDVLPPSFTSVSFEKDNSNSQNEICRVGWHDGPMPVSKPTNKVTMDMELLSRISDNTCLEMRELHIEMNSCPVCISKNVLENSDFTTCGGLNLMSKKSSSENHPLYERQFNNIPSRKNISKYCSDNTELLLNRGIEPVNKTTEACRSCTSNAKSAFSLRDHLSKDDKGNFQLSLYDVLMIKDAAIAPRTTDAVKRIAASDGLISAFEDAGTGLLGKTRSMSSRTDDASETGCSVSVVEEAAMCLMDKIESNSSNIDAIDSGLGIDCTRTNDNMEIISKNSSLCKIDAQKIESISQQKNVSGNYSKNNSLRSVVEESDMRLAVGAENISPQIDAHDHECISLRKNPSKNYAESNDLIPIGEEADNGLADRTESIPSPVDVIDDASENKHIQFDSGMNSMIKEVSFCPANEKNPDSSSSQRNSQENGSENYGLTLIDKLSRHHWEIRNQLKKIPSKKNAGKGKPLLDDKLMIVNKESSIQSRDATISETNYEADISAFSADNGAHYRPDNSFLAVVEGDLDYSLIEKKEELLHIGIHNSENSKRSNKVEEFLAPCGLSDPKIVVEEHLSTKASVKIKNVDSELQRVEQSTNHLIGSSSKNTELERLNAKGTVPVIVSPPAGDPISKQELVERYLSQHLTKALGPTKTMAQKFTSSRLPVALETNDSPLHQQSQHRQASVRLSPVALEASDGPLHQQSQQCQENVCFSPVTLEANDSPLDQQSQHRQATVRYSPVALEANDGPLHQQSQHRQASARYSPVALEANDGPLHQQSQHRQATARYSPASYQSGSFKAYSNPPRSSDLRPQADNHLFYPNTHKKGLLLKKLDSKEQRGSKHYCRPVLGGANFVVCYECSHLLQIPTDIHFSSRRCYKMRCGACFKIITFSVIGSKLKVPQKKN